MRSTRLNLWLLCLALATTTLPILPSPAIAMEEATAPNKAEPSDEKQSGNASFYSHHLTGRKTASGERYDPKALTAAHRTLPMGTKLRVTNPKNDRSVVVTVNDRGRLPKGRVVDVSSAAADALDMKKSGVTKVETRIVGKTATSPSATDGPDAAVAAPR